MLKVLCKGAQYLESRLHFESSKRFVCAQIFLISFIFSTNDIITSGGNGAVVEICSSIKVNKSLEIIFWSFLVLFIRICFKQPKSKKFISTQIGTSL